MKIASIFYNYKINTFKQMGYPIDEIREQFQNY